VPDFTRAEISHQTTDLTPYLTFLKRVSPGHVVTVPLDTGETSRKVMRAINAAAAQSELRLAKLDSPSGTVRFRVLTPEKRAVNLTEEAKRARVEKAQATREARRQVKAMGLPLIPDPTRHQGDRPIDAALAAPDLGLEEATPAEQQPPMATEQANRALAELPETAAVDPPPDQQVQEAVVEEAAPAPTSSRRRRTSRAAIGSKTP
jgi:hypothetical protein